MTIAGVAIFPAGLGVAGEMGRFGSGVVIGVFGVVASAGLAFGLGKVGLLLRG